MTQAQATPLITDEMRAEIGKESQPWTCEVDKTGRAIVFTTTMEHAELKRDQVHAYGKDRLVANCAGAMRSTIEPAPGDGD